MTDLRNGVIDIGGFEITPDITLETLLRYLENERINHELTKSYSDILDVFKIFEIEGQNFGLLFWFKNNKLEQIELHPYLALKEKIDRVKSQELRRKTSDSWMEKLLGKPEYKGETSTSYQMACGRIFSYITKNPIENYRGGFITIDFRRK